MHNSRLSTYPNLIDPNRLTVDKTKELGTGNYGAVYLGQLKSDHRSSYFEPVAIKMIHMKSKRTSPQELQGAMLEEIRIMLRIGDHENILQLKGSHKTAENELCMVTEYCSFSSLDKFLEKRRGNFDNEIMEYNRETGTKFKSQLNTIWASQFEDRRQFDRVSTSDLLCYAYQIANGMEFVHSREVVHRDLALRNVLLTANFSAKIGDFGLSRRTNRRTYRRNKNPKLPLSWTAPEVVFKDIVPIESDQWTFGILLWELFSLGETPYAQFHTFEQIWHFIVTKGRRLDKPQLASVEIYELMESLWNLKPTLRTSMEQCKRFLMEQLELACPPLSSRYKNPGGHVILRKPRLPSPPAPSEQPLLVHQQVLPAIPPEQPPPAPSEQPLPVSQQELSETPPEQLLTTFLQSPSTTYTPTVSLLQPITFLRSEVLQEEPSKKRANFCAKRYRRFIIAVCAVFIFCISAAVAINAILSQPSESLTDVPTSTWTTMTLSTIAIISSIATITKPTTSLISSTAAAAPVTATTTAPTTTVHECHATLLVCQGNSIINKSLVPEISDKQVITMHDGSSLIIDIDFDYPTNRIVWNTCCTEKDAIWTAMINGTDQKELIKVLRPMGISVDWTSKNVYYIDPHKSGIGVVSFDGRYNKMIITRLDNPFDMALDLVNRHLFFTESDQISRADLDGSNVIKFFFKLNILTPQGLVILHEQREVCWVDNGMHQLSCTTIEVNQDYLRPVYRYSNTSNAKFLTVHKKRFYWTTDYKVHSVFISGDDYTSFDVMDTLTSNLNGIMAVPENCSRVETECAVSNGGCPHLCLPRAGGGVSCAS